MSHLKQITTKQTVTPRKAIDPAGAAFLQIWATVMSIILFGAFGGKE